MSNSAGSSPFLESPVQSPSKVNGAAEKERKLISLQYKLNTIQNEFEIERLRLQQQNNSIDKKYRTTVEELEKALNDTKFLYDNNNKLEKELNEFKRKLGDIESSKDEEIQKLKLQLHTNETEAAQTISGYRSKIHKEEQENDTQRMELRNCKSLLERYKEAIAVKSEEINNLQREKSEMSGEIDALRASRLVMAHHNYSTEELQELTVINKSLQDQIQYTKELEEVNLQQANELKKLRISSESQQFWRTENGKLQNKLEQTSLLEKKLEEIQLENINLKSQLASWDIYNEDKDRPEDIVRELKLAKDTLVVLTDENEKIHLDNNNLKILNDELALERNQLLDLNKNYETSIINFKRLNHEIEQQKQLSFEECKLLRKQLDELTAFNVEAGQAEKGANTEEVKNFESIVDGYKNQTEDLTEELRKLNDQLLSQEPQSKKRKLSDQLGLNYSQRLNELQLNCVSLQRELQKSQNLNKILEKKVHRLTELKEKRIRILQLRDNPLLKDQFVKRKQLELLKKENQDLLQELETGKEGPMDRIPRSIYESLSFDLKERDDDLVKAGKKFIRLKEMFTKKSQEFIDVVNSLLGFKLEFQQEGRVKIFPCFKPERYLIADLNHNTLKSNLNSDFQDWDALLHLWVEKRGQIPCFLAALTLKLWEMSSNSQASKEYPK